MLTHSLGRFILCERGLNELVNINECSVSLSNCYLISLRERSVTMTKQLQALSDMRLTDIKYHFFAHLFFVNIETFHTPDNNYSPYRRKFGPSEYHLADFLYFYKEGRRISSMIKYFSIDSLSIFILNHFTHEKVHYSVIFGLDKDL